MGQARHAQNWFAGRTLRGSLTMVAQPLPLRALATLLAVAIGHTTGWCRTLRGPCRLAVD